jgi:hypothetical protein
MLSHTAILGLMMTCAAPALCQTVIDFDGLPPDTVLTDQYPEVTFSSSAGHQNLTHDFEGHSLPNILCTGPIGGEIDCIRDTYIDFTDPVNNLTFWAIEANLPGKTASFNVWTHGGFQQIDFISEGRRGYQLVDLSHLSGITRLEIVDIIDDPGERGIGWDTFSFTVIPASPTVALFGVAGAVASRRRRL